MAVLSRLPAFLRCGGGQTAAALDELAETVPSEQSLEKTVERRELARYLDAYLRTLPETERTVFMARYFYLLPVKEIALRLGFTESKVKSMLSRTRAKLKKHLKEEGLL